MDIASVVSAIGLILTLILSFIQTEMSYALIAGVNYTVEMVGAELAYANLIK